MAIKQFKTESKRLLDLMANSIYTNTDIFLRELISNASDALDKKHMASLQDTSIDASNLNIRIDVDKKEKTITITDNGIGMNSKELEENLGTIAKSGSYDFKKELEDNKEVDIIGQFGVGFYSAFMVADKVEVISKKIKEDKAYKWTSDMNGYEITSANKDTEGTIIALHIKDNTKEKKYDQYLDTNEIESLVRKYSDFIRYPIQMEVEETKTTEDNKTETVKELKTINSMTPIWKKNKKDIKKEDYDEFYSMNYFDFEKPLKTLHYKVEGNTSYTALLYIPSKRPYNYFTTDYKLGVKLYSRGVFIKDEAKEIVPDYFRFIRGVVDSDDLNLNISREILQEDYQTNALKKSIQKKIKSCLVTMLEKERTDYEKFFDEFGQQIKFGVYDKYGENKDELIDLVLFKSSKEGKYVTLKEYVSNMKKGQKEIYYASGESIEKIKELPQMEKIIDKGYEVLYFTDNVDEFMASIIMKYDDKEFKSIQKGELDLDSKEEKEEIKKKEEESKDLIAKIKEVLKDSVQDVKISARLKTSPVCLVSDNNLSIEMEKVLKEMHQEGVKATKILEINPDHDVFKALEKAYKANEDISDYALLLYDQARLLAGLTVDDPNAYTKRISNIMVKAIK